MKNLKFLLVIAILLVQCKTPYENESKIIFKINEFDFDNNQMDVSMIDLDQWVSGDTLYYEEDRIDVIFNKSQLPQFNDLRSVRITNKKEKSLYRK